MHLAVHIYVPDTRCCTACLQSTPINEHLLAPLLQIVEDIMGLWPTLSDHKHELHL
jgi:hypothetical protein